MKKISLLTSVLITSFSAAATAVAPIPLTFYNLTGGDDTRYGTSVTISVNKQCSTAFGEIKPRSHKAVGTSELMDLCQENNVNCEAKVFKGPACTGEQLASFTFDALNGVRMETGDSDNYYLSIHYDDNSVVFNSRGEG